MLLYKMNIYLSMPTKQFTEVIGIIEKYAYMLPVLYTVISRVIFPELNVLSAKFLEKKIKFESRRNCFFFIAL